MVVVSEDELSELALCMLGSHLWSTNRVKEKSEIYPLNTAINQSTDN